MPRFLKSPLVSGVLLLFFILTAVRLISVYREERALREKEEAFSRRVSALEEQNRKTREELRIASTPEAIERDAKARLNLKKPGERVTVVIQSDMPTTTPSEDPGLWGRIKSLFSF